MNVSDKHNKFYYFDVLLTVQLSIFISVINQLDAQNFCFTISLFHASTCFEHHAFIIMVSSRGCVIQFWPHDDEHMCSKHVEAWNKLTAKQTFCASSWLITEINFIMLFYCLGQHVSTFTGSSSGPSKIQILKLAVIKMPCAVPNAYILDITTCMYKNRCH